VLSEYPADRLIRNVIATRRQTTDTEVEQIIQRIASAPFDPRTDALVPLKDRGLFYQGVTLGPRAPALTYHLAKRVVGDREWASGTTAVQYLVDLRSAILAPDSRLVLYRRRGGHVATVLTVNRLPAARLGLEAKAMILVVFSADRGTIITGYQTAHSSPRNIPEDALWLK